MFAGSTDFDPILSPRLIRHLWIQFGPSCWNNFLARFTHLLQGGSPLLKHSNRFFGWVPRRFRRFRKRLTRFYTDQTRFAHLTMTLSSAVACGTQAEVLTPLLLNFVLLFGALLHGWIRLVLVVNLSTVSISGSHRSSGYDQSQDGSGSTRWHTLA